MGEVEVGVPAWTDPARLQAGEHEAGNDGFMRIAPNQDLAFAARDREYRRFDREGTPARREERVVRAHGLGHQCLRIFEVAVRRLTIVETCSREDIVPQGVTKHLQHTRICAATLPVPRRSETVPFETTVFSEGVEDWRFALIHERYVHPLGSDVTAPYGTRGARYATPSTAA
jgi:hypothetical protein